MEAILVKAAGLALIILAGYTLKRLGVFRTEDAKVISRVVINLTLPAAFITGFRGFQFQAEYLIVIAIALVCNFLLLGIAFLMTKGKDIPARALYAMNLSSYNIGTFVMPFAQSFLPAQAIVGVSMFDAGNCPVNCGISYALIMGKNSGSVRASLKMVADKLLHSVPFMTYLFLMIKCVIGLEFPEPVYTVASMVGGANSFLAMLMIGILFQVRVEKEDLRQVLQILGVRYGVNLLMIALLWHTPLSLMVRQVLALALVAPVPSVALVFCERCGCKPSVYGMISSLSIAVSLILTFSLMLLKLF